jgi:solute carrier family 25 S-adenosylmethionine transporter 26
MVSSSWHVGRAYRGLLSSTLGAIPSSALYFGTYANVKRILHRRVRQRLRVQKQLLTATKNDDLSRPVDLHFSYRLGIHALAAASGNLASSAIFVPKETLKQKMQYTGQGLGATLTTLWTAGSATTSSGILWRRPAVQFVTSLYRGWQTTLLRNVPSAILRFCIYEELKRAMIVSAAASTLHSTGSIRRNRHGHGQLGARPTHLPAATAIPFRIFLAGAVAGALASGIMTPFDVLKTRVSTGTCPVDLPACVNLVVSEQGWKGLYAGAGSRMAFSGAFSAIGFGTYEMAKVWLNVSDDAENESDD